MKIQSNFSSGHYITNPDNALSQGKSLKITSNICMTFDSPKMGNLMTPVFPHITPVRPGRNVQLLISTLRDSPAVQRHANDDWSTGLPAKQGFHRRPVLREFQWLIRRLSKAWFVGEGFVEIG